MSPTGKLETDKIDEKVEEVFDAVAEKQKRESIFQQGEINPLTDLKGVAPKKWRLF